MIPSVTCIRFLGLLWLWAALSGAAWGMEAQAQRLSSTEYIITLPMPSQGMQGAAIIAQQLPKGVTMVRCTPDPTAYHRKKGMVKWLIERPAGPVEIHEALDRGVEPSQLQFTLSFRGEGGVKRVRYGITVVGDGHPARH